MPGIAGLQSGTAGPMSSVGLALRFSVVVDDLYNLGLWRSCKGLSVTFKSKPQFSGGVYDAPTSMLAEEMEYSPITLQRAISLPDTQTVYNWLSSAASGWFGDEGYNYRGSTAKITLLGADNKEVFSWSLRHVYPSKWSGPDLDSGTSAVALETLELKHAGFL